MDWKAVIAELDGFGLSQPQIAVACQCAQSTISSLATGGSKEPRHSLGERLLRLLEAKRREAPEKAVTAPPPAPGAADDDQVLPQLGNTEFEERPATAA